MIMQVLKIIGLVYLGICVFDIIVIGIWAIMVYKDKKGEGKDDM